jgi:ribokinase
MKFDVVCFGALNVDKIFKVDHIAREDEESTILELKFFPGGSAANTAVALSKLGAKVGFIGKVSDDREGGLLLSALKEEGVDTSKIIISKEGHSGFVLGFVDRRGDRALYVSPGVNDELEFSEIDQKYVRSSKFLHLSSFVGERPFEAQKRLVDVLRGVNVTFDPGMIYARKGLKKLRPILRKCFAFLPSKAEIELLTGENYEEAVKILHEEGVKIVAVKLGERGCYVSDGEETHHIKPFKVKVIDTTGAGDAFSAGFIYGLLRRKSLKECGIIGNFLASKIIQGYGARANLPRKEELPF